MRILLTGATGFIGKRLAAELHRNGHQLVVLSRNPSKVASLGVPAQAFSWQPEQAPPPAEACQGIQAAISLAGEGIAEKRWSTTQKKKIYDSRILGTRHFLQGLAQAAQKPQTVICASAIGYYGARGDEAVTEASAPGTGFLADVCKDWENEVVKNPIPGVRTVRVRIGVVLGAHGGMLKRLLPLFKLGLGGPTGTGKQWISWIHLSDLVGIFQYVLSHPEVSGVLNGVAPHPVTSREFAQVLGHALHRPSFARAPGFALKLVLGKMSEMILEGQKVLPEATEACGFQFHFPSIVEAISEIVKNKEIAPISGSLTRSGFPSP